MPDLCGNEWAESIQAGLSLRPQIHNLVGEKDKIASQQNSGVQDGLEQGRNTAPAEGLRDADSQAASQELWG